MNNINIKKKAQGIAVNTVVMLIIGVVIFGLGMGLFYKLSGSSEDIVGDLNNQIKSDIASLECDGDEWICSPSYEMKRNEKGTFAIFVANKGIDAAKFSIKIKGTPVGDGNVEYDNNGCVANIYFPINEVNIRSGESAQIPFVVKDTIVKEGCSIITTAELIKDNTDTGEKTSIIVRVK